jgi:hypothetical protein
MDQPKMGRIGGKTRLIRLQLRNTARPSAGLFVGIGALARGLIIHAIKACRVTLAGPFVLIRRRMDDPVDWVPPPLTIEVAVPIHVAIVC